MWLSYRVNDHVILVNNMEVTNVDKRTVLQAMKGSGGHINMVSVVMEMIVLLIQLHSSLFNQLHAKLIFFKDKFGDK